MTQRSGPAAALFVLLLGACGGGSGGGGGAPAPTASSTPTAAPAVVSAVSATVLKTGQAFTLQGTDLQRAARFLLAGEALQVTFNDGTRAQLTAPAAATAGPLSYEDGGGTRRDTAYELKVYAPATVSGLAPLRGRAGTAVVLTGQALEAASGVAFGAVPATVVSAAPGSLTVAVPPGAASGPITIRTPYETLTTADRFEVLPTATVSALTALETGGGVRLSIEGTHLDQVVQVRVAGTVAPIVSQAADRIVAAATTDGAVVLDTGDPIAIAAGTFTRTGASRISVAPLELAQGFLFTAAEPALRLVPGKPALARVRITDATGGAAPAVTLVGLRSDGSRLGERPLLGPATLPATVADADLAASFSAVVPGAWIAPGLSLRVDVAGVAGTALPIVVGAATRIDLVLVPVVIGGTTPDMPDPAAVKDRLVRLYPYAAGAITVTRAAPWVGGSRPFANATEVGDLLTRLEQKRLAEAPGKYYYGIWPALQSGQSATSGLGFVNPPQWALSAATSAVGVDGFTGQFGTPDQNPFDSRVSPALAVMIHEIGHLHGLAHAPCGGAASPDASYPYAAGALGARVLYDSSYLDTDAGVLASPIVSFLPATDLMGYCNGLQFSDYHYALARQFAEAHTAAFGLSGMAALRLTEAAPSLLSYAGVITDAGVRLQPVATAAQRRSQPTPADAPYRLRLVTAAGETIDVPFLPLALSHPGPSAFFVTLPAPDSPVVQVQVLRDGRVLPSQAVGP